MTIRDPGWRQFGSGIRDGKKSDPGSGTNIPDPQHCFEGTFTSFFKDKKSKKELQNSRNQGFYYYFCMMIEGSGSRAGSGSMSLASGSGSGRPKNMWMRIRIRIRNTASKRRHSLNSKTSETAGSVWNSYKSGRKWSQKHGCECVFL
jgi:hypothetical protein